MEESLRHLLEEGEGMEIYEYIVNHAETGLESLTSLISRLRTVDTTGQFLASTARFLAAVDRQAFAPYFPDLLSGAIENDKERRYIGSLLQALWGPDYMERAEELRESDDNFRRIYKRIFQREV